MGLYFTNNILVPQYCHTRCSLCLSLSITFFFCLKFLKSDFKKISFNILIVTELKDHNYFNFFKKLSLLKLKI